MSASDNMNATQFPIEEVGKMQSSDFPGMTMEEAYQSVPRGQRLLYFTTRNPGNYYRGQPSIQPWTRMTASGKSVYHRPAKHRGNVMAKQRDLEASVAAHGVQEPLEGSHWGPGDTKIMQGHHRYWAARDTGQTHLPVEMADWTK